MMNNSYLLLGYGISNKAIKEYFDEENISYIIYDDFIEDYKTDVNFNDFNIVIKSSGLENDHYLLNYARILNKIIITDLEFFYRLNKNKKIICVSGSNGKTTTVSLIHHVIDEADLGGNIGYPLANFIKSSKDIIIEASSFMLEYVSNFHSSINLYTNIYINHIEHHKNFKNYVRAKLNLIKNIKEDDYLIYNYDCILLRRLFKYLDVRKIEFSLEEKTNLYLDDNIIYYNNEPIFNINQVKLKGRHNKYNILACIAAIICYDKNRLSDITKINNFLPLEHRIEYIGKYNGISIYNDSKSTNFNALKNSLDTFSDENILLIVGGKLKDDNYNVIKNSLDQVKFVIINGENRVVLSNFFKSFNKDILIVDNLIAAISLLKQYLNNISLILLSPGSSSYDQFNNYEERGKFFKTKIKELFELEIE